MMRMLIMRIAKLLGSTFVSSLLFLSLITSAQAQYDTPTDTVQNMLDNVFAILRAPDFDLDRDKAAIDEAVSGAFDPNTIAQSALAASYRDLTTEQRREFEELFFDVLKQTYIERLDSYTNETVEILGESVDAPRATVDSVVNTSSSDIAVQYSLRQRPDGWYIYDIIVEDVSLLSSYRSTYRSIIRRSGIDALFEELRTQAATLE
ncbi:MAG: hypothetical protein CMP91_04245 [Gammaproteobacteria bacterium]|nr:hypothetical protein [Gammaproteobacteria bacterium]MAY01890.1 hypothetical protein [Gammaproteobacteria bacterium]